MFHATCDCLGSLPNFAYKNVALEEPGKVHSLLLYFCQGAAVPARCPRFHGMCSCNRTSFHLAEGHETCFLPSRDPRVCRHLV